MEFGLTTVCRFEPWYVALFRPISVTVSLLFMVAIIRATITAFRLKTGKAAPVRSFRLKPRLYFYLIIMCSSVMFSSFALNYHFTVEEPEVAKYEQQNPNSLIVREALNRELKEILTYAGAPIVLGGILLLLLRVEKLQSTLNVEAT